MSVNSRPTIAEIDLNKLRENFRSCRSFIGTDVQYLAVVKADAYGHGAAACSRALEKEGVQWFGVATPEEAIELRSAGITSRILCLGSFWPGQEDLLIQNGITPVIFELERATTLDEAAGTAAVRFPVHIKLDTGMGRLGFPWNRATEIAKHLLTFENLRIEGVMTHFAAADDLDEAEFSAMQVTRFRESIAAFRAVGFDPEIIDVSNSPGAVVTGRNGGNMVRLGGVLYGLAGDILPENVEKPVLKPIMSLKSQISHLKTIPAGHSVGYGRTFTAQRESQIAAVPIGYHDGYRRVLSNAASVLIRGSIVPVIGRVSMDWITVDVTNVGSVSIGDEVTMIGRDRNEEIRAEDLARMSGTISYEITCGISGRVPRRFVGESTDLDVSLELSSA